MGTSGICKWIHSAEYSSKIIIRWKLTWGLDGKIIADFISEIGMMIDNVASAQGFWIVKYYS